MLSGINSLSRSLSSPPFLLWYLSLKIARPFSIANIYFLTVCLFVVFAFPFLSDVSSRLWFAFGWRRLCNFFLLYAKRIRTLGSFMLLRFRLVDGSYWGRSSRRKALRLVLHHGKDTSPRNSQGEWPTFAFIRSVVSLGGSSTNTDRLMCTTGTPGTERRCTRNG